MDLAQEWYYLEDARLIDSPALIIFKRGVQENIETMIRIAGSADRLMPHVKTYKLAEVISMQTAAGIRKFKCATLAEAELLGIARASEALLAHQPSEIKINRLADLVRNYPETKFSTLIDNLHTAEMIDGVLRSKGVIMDIYLDINNGNNRTGTVPEKAFDLYAQCLNLKSINMAGLHVYDGHIRHADPEERKKACDHDYKPVAQLFHDLLKRLDVNPRIIAGGSPTFQIHAQRENVICSPGTTLFWDAGYASQFQDLPFRPAAVLVTRVISRPAEGLLCLDLGHKAVASENPISNRVRFLNAEGLEPVSHSEEHLVVKNMHNLPLHPGDVLYGLPYHICPTTALYSEVLVSEGRKIVDRWEVIARNRKINY